MDYSNEDFPAGSVHEGIYGVFVVLVPPSGSHWEAWVFWLESPFRALHNRSLLTPVYVYKTKRLA